MTTDAEVACPDPHCGARFRITRGARRTFRHADVTAVPLPLSWRRRHESSSPRLHDLARHQGRLAAGRRTRPGGRAAAIADMHAFVDAGITTFDCADIYTGVEALIGDFVRGRGHSARSADPHQVRARSRAARPPDAPRRRGRRRTIADAARVDALDLVQFHWWDYDAPGAIDVLGWLADERQAGRIRHLGVTNFDTPTLAALLDAGLPIVSHQVRYSVLDRRPAGPMQALCAARGVALLCYGALAGGFLSERYLGHRGRGRGSGESVAGEVPPDHRRSRRLDALARPAGGPRSCGPRPRMRTGRSGRGLGAAPAAGGRGDRRRAARRSPARHGDRRVAQARATTTSRIIDEAIADGPTVPGDVYGLERVKGGRHAGDDAVRAEFQRLARRASPSRRAARQQKPPRGGAKAPPYERAADRMTPHANAGVSDRHGPRRTGAHHRAGAAVPRCRRRRDLRPHGASARARSGAATRRTHRRRAAGPRSAPIRTPSASCWRRRPARARSSRG